ncbi:hypothetical protein D3C84_1061530 [compost metagenome]
MVQVVEHQHQFTATAGNAAHQGDDRAFHRLAVDTATFQLDGFLNEHRINLAEAGQQIVEKPRQFVVVGRQGQPGHIKAQR